MNKKPLLILLTLFLVLIVLINLNSGNVSCSVTSTFNESNLNTGFIYNWVYNQSGAACTYGFGSNGLYFNDTGGYSQGFFLNINQLANYSSVFPTTYIYKINLSVLSTTYNTYYAGLTDRSNYSVTSVFTRTTETVFGIWWQLNPYDNTFALLYYNGTASTTLYSTTYASGAWKNCSLILSESSYNIFSISADVNSISVYNGTSLTILFNGTITPAIVDYCNNAFSPTGYVKTMYYSSSIPYLVLSTQTFRIFSGFVGTVISNIWTTFQSVPLYISQVVSKIISGFPQVISSITAYMQCIFNQISQVVTKIYSGIVTYLSTIHTLFKVGYKTGIAYVTIHILNPLITAISQVVFSIKTGIINFISAITIYIYSTGVIPPNVSPLSVGYLVVLMLLLIPSFIIKYISNMLVLPMFDFMAIICFIGNQISVVSLVFIIIASIPLMLNSDGDDD
jgi:hypothetical protein